MSDQSSEFDRLLTQAQALVADIRIAPTERERNDLLDLLSAVLGKIGNERVGLQEHVDEAVRAVRALGERVQ